MVADRGQPINEQESQYGPEDYEAFHLPFPNKDELALMSSRTWPEQRAGLAVGKKSVCAIYVSAQKIPARRLGSGLAKDKFRVGAMQAGRCGV